MATKFLRRQDLSVGVINLEGGSGSGKTTLGWALARELGWDFLDIGLWYRGLTIVCDREGILSISSRARRVESLTVEVKQGGLIYVDGIDETKEIHCQRITNRTPSIAKIKEVRDAMKLVLFKHRKAPGLVVAGRDCADLFPNAFNAFVKITLEEAARRRELQAQQRGESVNYVETLASLRARDHQDRNRPHGALIERPGSLIVDTTHQSVEVCKNLVLAESAPYRMNYVSQAV